jgi:RNA polymerase sigma factor (TIGR02999 family)
MSHAADARRWPLPMLHTRLRALQPANMLDRGARRAHRPRLIPAFKSRAEHPCMTEDRLSATDLLLRAGAGEARAVESIFPVVYDELRRLAHRHLSREPDGRTLGTTELVHEAYLRLIDQTRVQWTGRAHFMAIAATAMRRILVDRARSRRSLKRGGDRKPVTLDDIEVITDERADLLVALDEALDRLRDLDARQARVVECRFFGGMTEEETAEVLGVGLRTAKRDWAKAKSWLYRELHREALT